jgi:hypothetical protein
VNVIQAISYGANLTNAGISATDTQTSAGTYLDSYWFTGAAGDNVQITMRSSAFDAFLILQKIRAECPLLPTTIAAAVSTHVSISNCLKRECISCSPHPTSRTRRGVYIDLEQDRESYSGNRGRIRRGLGPRSAEEGANDSTVRWEIEPAKFSAI